jgi:hypothetical protein
MAADTAEGIYVGVIVVLKELLMLFVQYPRRGSELDW